MSLFGHKAPVVDVLIVRYLDAVVSFAEDGVSVLDFEERNLKNVRRKRRRWAGIAQSV